VKQFTRGPRFTRYRAYASGTTFGHWHLNDNFTHLAPRGGFFFPTGMLRSARVSSADQSVERHHQYEGEACDTDEHDAKEHVLHALITAALQDGFNKNPRSQGAMSGDSDASNWMWAMLLA